jgi:hypothetical protein
MPKTAVGLFHDIKQAERVIREIEDIGFRRNHVQLSGEPLDLGKGGVTTIPGIEFEVPLTRELMRIGATKPEADAYVDGVRHNEVLVCATGPSDRADAAVKIMKRSYAISSQKLRSAEPGLPSANLEITPLPGTSAHPGRVRSLDGNATVFTW